MTCSGRWAEAWQFTSFWCISAMLKGQDDGGGAGVAFLTDSQVDFAAFGIEANVGMTLYNLTQGTSGPVTAVAPNTLTATGVIWNDGDLYRIVAMTRAEQSAAENALDIAATDVHSALAAADACDCTLAGWAYDATQLGYSYLAKLNIIDAAIYHDCPCAKTHISEEMRKAYMAWVDTELELIRTGKKELCEGATGADFPAAGYAELTWTNFNVGRILENEAMRRGG
jgi:hypothetical protein